LNGWRVFDSPTHVAKFLFQLLKIIDTASATTGQIILREWLWHFFKAMVELPVSLHEGSRSFCIVAIFFQTETSSPLVNLKTLAIFPISVLASFMHYQIVRLIPDRFIKRLSA